MIGPRHSQNQVLFILIFLEVRDEKCEFITPEYNLLKISFLPEDWKEANATSVSKKRSGSVLENYLYI